MRLNFDLSTNDLELIANRLADHTDAFARALKARFETHLVDLANPETLAKAKAYRAAAETMDPAEAAAAQHLNGAKSEAPVWLGDGDAEMSGAYVMSWIWVDAIDAIDAGVCTECGAVDADDGDGYAGLCGNCADRAYADVDDDVSPPAGVTRRRHRRAK